MGLEVLAATAVVSTVGGALAGEKKAKAIGDAANAQLGQQQADRDLALKYAEPSPDELKQLNQAIGLNETDIARKQKLLDSSDPAIIEAGKQALQLLRGEDAKTLAPLRTNIAKQESALREKLMAQLGPGYENTTAGLQALQAFNEQANGALVNAQQGSLAQLLGVAQDTSGRYGLQSNIANASGLAGMFGNISNRQVSAIRGTPIAAGNQFMGDYASAANQQETFGNMINLGSTLYSAGAFGGSGSTAKSPFASGTQVAADNKNPYSMES